MADIWLGRISRWIEKYLNAKGGPVIVDVAPALQPIITLQSGVEDRYLQGWNRFAVAVVQAAVAANFSRVRIRNPVGTNVIIVLEQLAVFESAVDSPQVSWGATTTDLATLVTLTFTRMDPRGNPQPVAIVSQNSQAAGGQALLLRGNTNANNTDDFIQNPNQEIPILPGQALDIQSQVVNIQLGVTFMWRERPLESSEFN